MQRPYRTLIVDDEPAARATLHALLADEPRLVAVGEAADGNDAVRKIRELQPDLVFLDVQMPDRDGFGVLDALGDDMPCAVVFVTAHDAHALRAFEVHALDYLLKPFGRPRFRKAVQRAVQQLDAQDAYVLRRTLTALAQDNRTAPTPAVLAGAQSRFAVRAGDRTLIVQVDDVDWIEAERDYVRLHTGKGVHMIAERMHALESRLDPARWFRIHRSSIVNLSRISELRRAEDGGGVAVLGNGVQLRVARNRWGGLEEALQLGG